MSGSQGHMSGSQGHRGASASVSMLPVTLTSPNGPPDLRVNTAAPTPPPLLHRLAALRAGHGVSCPGPQRPLQERKSGGRDAVTADHTVKDTHTSHQDVP
ncbi:hypothetical protein EYF80_050323 [Liparis tanakae]|uniref:Uncharacterized protein n=1 Tax=Liparis tanakae TaxID=230148 RepID=A0A4Z2FED1_9TELE|nr:hypothetical protein EYF80_050323 [Liparis tanakae]